MLSVLLHSVLGCTSAGAPDSERYLLALTRDPAEAAEICAQISADALSGECLAFAAAAAAEQGELALARRICQQPSLQLWQEECSFLIADRLHRQGAASSEDCALAGRLEEDCRSHALERGVSAAQRAHGAIGAEQALLVDLTTLAQHHGTSDDPADWPAAGELILAHLIARRMGPDPLQRSRCGVASEDVCGKAYLIALSSFSPQVEGREACTLPRDPAAFAAAGFRPWAAGDALAEQAWEVFCQKVAAGADPQRLGELLGGAPAVPLGTYLMPPLPYQPALPGAHQNRRAQSRGKRPRRP